MDLSSIHLKVSRCFDLIEISTKCFKNMLEPFYKVEKCKFFYFAFVFHVILFVFIKNGRKNVTFDGKVEFLECLSAMDPFCLNDSMYPNGHGLHKQSCDTTRSLKKLNTGIT